MDKKDLLKEIEETRVDCSVRDWDGYDGEPVHPKSIEYTLKFIEKFPVDLPIPNASATPASTMGIEWSKNNDDLFITVDKDGNFYCTSVFENEKDDIMFQYKFEDEVSDFENKMFDIIKKKFKC